MNQKIYQIDAFTNKLFGGNPAAVCPLAEWLPDETMQNIAAENNLAETAFFIPTETGFHLRWFTPAVEVDFCGHATLATSHVLFKHLNYDKEIIQFHTRVGKLEVRQKGDNYVMNFPTDILRFIETPPPALLKSLNISSNEIFKGRDDYLIIVDDQKIVEELNPDFKLLETVGLRGVIVSSPGRKVDFVSRCFFPAAGIDEDPVTGSAHTTLTPYWSQKLGKKEMVGIQISLRTGLVNCNYLGDRVELSGQAVTYMVGEIFIDR